MTQPAWDDEPIDAEDSSIEAPRTISRGAFLGLATVTMSVLFLVERIAAEAVGWALGFRIEPGWISGLGLPNLVMANIFVDRILKRFGLSRRGTTREVRKRTVAFVEAEGTAAEGERLELRMWPRLILGMGLVCLLFDPIGGLILVSCSL